ncbi:MAG: hypothetical protein N2044_01760 [Cyclobacteriaceae bacterium]|nr:hypothetical protein [Cyclobacteriaceae bacterium]MCX7636549.1 hypothetical protein [Cyclobacteriaceae bacterium]MDW8330563.1 hypothetical protein [Cyclobacteriaceae bacterium]
MKARRISLDEIRNVQFAAEDVLSSFEEKFEREHKLKTAMALTNADHEEISLYVRLADGEVVELVSDLIDLEEDYVEVRGGFGIPLRAIVDVGV